jgi:hypothetical protein
MPPLLAAVLTTCHIAFDVSPGPQTLPSLLILRKIIPPEIPAAEVHSSTCVLDPTRHRHGPDMPALSDEVSDNPVFLSKL